MNKREAMKINATLAIRAWFIRRVGLRQDTPIEAVEARIRDLYPSLDPEEMAYVKEFHDPRQRAPQ